MIKKKIKILKKLINPNFSQYKDEWIGKRKIKTKVIEKYEAIPDFLNMKKKDPFDYRLRSIQEVKNDLKDEKFNLPLEIKFFKFPEFLPKHKQKQKNRPVIFICDMKKIFLSEKQKERMVYLVGDRYNEKKEHWKMRIDYFDDPELNMKRGFEIIDELYLETLRAPADLVFEA